MQKTAASIPYLSNRVYVEQINVKVDPKTKQRAQILRGHGIDTGELFRQKIAETIETVFGALGLEDAG